VEAASEQSLQRVLSLRSLLQVEFKGVSGPTLLIQSWMVLIPAQAEELKTKRVGLGKQRGTMFWWMDKAESLSVKSCKQVEEVFASGR